MRIEIPSGHQTIWSRRLCFF